MPAALLPALLAALLSAAPAGGAGRAGEAAPDSADAALVRLRFAWPAPLRARVAFRRTRLGPGAPPSAFTARYEARVEAGAEGLRLTTGGTSWRGDLPFPRALAKEAIRASEVVVQRVRPDGEFAGLDGVEALRPVLARVFEEARVPPDAAERALPLAEAAARAEAEELWNLAVGFWTGADLRLGETYALESEGELPLVPGTRARQDVEFEVSRRVPCAAGERAARCVEATLRATPDAAALARAARPLLARLFPAGGPGGGAAPGALAAASELLLVTEPETLLPRRVVWTKSVRVEGDGGEEVALVERSEWDYRWRAPEPPQQRRRRAPAATPAKPTPGPEPDAKPQPTAARRPAASTG